MRSNRLVIALRSLLLPHPEIETHAETSEVVGSPVVRGAGDSHCASSSTSLSALVKYFLKHFIRLFFLECFLGRFLEYFLEFFATLNSMGTVGAWRSRNSFG